MGEIAEMMLDGTMCQVCGEFLDSDNGYPTTCGGCDTEEIIEPRPKKKKKKVKITRKIKCPICEKTVKIEGLGHHVQHVHYKEGELSNEKTS